MGIYPFEDYENYSPYIHTPNDLIGTSVNSFEMGQQYCQMNIACLAEIANPVGSTPQVYCNPVSNFEFAFPIDKDVMELYLIWDAPEDGSTGELEHFDVYRDNAVIATVQYDPTIIHHLYTDTITIGAQAEYFIMSVYSDGCEAPSETLIGEGIPHQLSESASHVSVYPNPAESLLNIVANGLQRIAVYNMMGQLIEKKIAEGNQFVLQVGDYAPGLYTVQVVTANGVVTENIVVK